MIITNINHVDNNSYLILEIFDITKLSICLIIMNSNITLIKFHLIEINSNINVVNSCYFISQILIIGGYFSFI